MSKMKLEHILLGVLIERPRTGYDIKRFMDTHGTFIRANTQMSQVYRALTELHSRGWAAYDTEDRPGAHDAKIYRATDEGETVFFDWLTSPYSPSTALPDPEFRGRLQFAGFMHREQLIELIDTEIDGRRRQVAKYRLRDRSIEVLPESGYDMELGWMVAEHMHKLGTAAMDDHIAGMRALRKRVLDVDRRRDDATPAALSIEEPA